VRCLHQGHHFGTCPALLALDHADIHEIAWNHARDKDDAACKRPLGRVSQAVSAMDPTVDAKTMLMGGRAVVVHRVPCAGVNGGEHTAAMKVCVTHKKVRPPPTDELAAASDAIERALWERRSIAATEHAASFESVTAALAARNLTVVFHRLGEDPTPHDVDLIVTIGGDGTFLAAARHAATEPLLGVNSAPTTSEGHYCGATAADFGAQLDAILAGEGVAAQLTRIRVTIDDVVVGHPVLNDVLFANASPAGSARYAVVVDAGVEHQLSSGLWISTASGSTAAISSAGGDVMVRLDRRLQYLVREPYRPRGRVYNLLHGYVDTKITLLSRSPHNAVYLDGRREGFAAPLGSRTVLTPAGTPLHVYGYGD
jgi:NAD+ kinase